MQEWINLELTTNETEVVVGTPKNALVRPRTKNLVEAPEKCFKTTFMLRFMAGLSCGETVFQSLPVVRPRKVLYLHGELSDAEIQDRTIAASTDLPKPYNNLTEGRALNAHLVRMDGQRVLREIISEQAPEDVVLDPWQSFIAGCDENNFKEMSVALEFCNSLIDEYGITLWIPIHLGKNHKRGARGHSTIAGWRDTRFQLSRPNQGCVRVAVEPRWAAPPEPFFLEFKDGTLWGADDGSVGGRTGKIVSFVSSKGGRCTKDELLTHLGNATKRAYEASRKAISWAKEAGAIGFDDNGVFIPLQSEEESTGTIN